jgi:DNA modification methylase
MQIEYWPISRLVPYHRKLRKGDDTVARMEASITEFGLKIPILVRSDGEVVDGALRLETARKMGFSEVPVLLCDEWSPAQVKAFRLMVNRSATWADWDTDLVKLELADLKAADFDLNLTGFDATEIDDFLLDNAEGDPEETVPEPPVNPVSRVGDMWILGKHRVLCDDATSAEAVNRLLGGEKPNLMIIDPPYSVAYDPGWRERAGLGRQRQTGTVPNDDRVDWSAAYLLFPGDVAYVWHAGTHAAEVAANLESAGFRIRSQIVWAKQHFALSRGDYHWQHESCWYAVREGKPSRWNGDRTQSTLWQVANLNPFGGSSEPATGHGTQKPLELMRRPILNNSVRGELVYDAFLGSGTTLVAAHLTGRDCFGLDIDPGYVDVVVKRWQTLTNQPAILEGDGRTFEQISAERCPVAEAA